MDKSYNARILQIMNENSSYKFNYFYYEIKNYTHKDYSKVAYEIEDFVDNSYISSIAKNKRAEIYCFFILKDGGIGELTWMIPKKLAIMA